VECSHEHKRYQHCSSRVCRIAQCFCFAIGTGMNKAREYIVINVMIKASEVKNRTRVMWTAFNIEQQSTIKPKLDAIRNKSAHQVYFLYTHPCTL